ncbi:hypothetical protein CALVIDRAFT_540906, partial [Calocera viscosa TUFC12733]
MLLTVPSEIIDAIIENIDNPRDLAALSVVCKTLKERILPASGEELGLLQCCYLSVSMDDIRVFDALAERPHLAGGIRKFHISRHPPYHRYWRTGSEIVPPGVNVAPSTLRNALCSMRTLRFLSCDLLLTPTTDLSHVFKNLHRRCPDLAEVHLKLDATDPVEYQSDFGPPTLDGFSHLEALELEVNEDAFTGLLPPAVEDYVDRLGITLDRIASSLRHLSLAWYMDTADRLFDRFANLELPALVSLSLASYTRTTKKRSCDAMGTFLARHPRIQYLKIRGRLPVRIHPDTSPNLREMSIRFMGAARFNPLVSPLSSGNYRPLRRVELARHLPDLAAVLEDICSKRTAAIPSLKGLRLNELNPVDGKFLRHLAGTRPDLEELHCTLGGSQRSETEKIDALKKLLRIFPHLRSVQESGDVGWFIDDETLESELPELGNLHPNLMCVNDWARQDGNVWNHKGWKCFHIGNTHNLWNQDDDETSLWKWAVLAEVDCYGFAVPRSTLFRDEI